MLNADTNPLPPPTVEGGVCSFIFLAVLSVLLAPLFFVPFFCVLLLLSFLLFFAPGVTERPLAKRLNSNLLLLSSMHPLTFPVVVGDDIGPSDGNIPIIMPRSSFPRPVFGTGAARGAGPFALSLPCCCCCCCC